MKMVDLILAPLCCNANHYFTVWFLGKPRRFCTRSVPMLFGALSSIGVVTVMGLSELEGVMVAAVGVFLVLLDLVYWALTRVEVVADIIEVRVVTGFLLGLGVVVFGQAAIPVEYKVGVPLFFIVLMLVADRVVVRK